MNAFPQNSTIVLVHGASADGSCWTNIILLLRRQGLDVICAPIPLTSLTNDATALSWALERTSGPVLLVASNGSVVLISGSAALDPKPGFAAVAATNAAIIALAKAFAEQGVKDGVQVNSVVPGPVMTGRRQSFFERWAPAHNFTVEEAIKKFPEEVGITRFGKPQEIAGLLSYLVSPEAKWLTGACVRMDGGEIKGI
jgi:NAD(P)-dependent dehydrogenase (short-subunit alcohol dehydrogenase family)